MWNVKKLITSKLRVYRWLLESEENKGGGMGKVWSMRIKLQLSKNKKFGCVSA
jgi:hypothetical protein